MDSENEQASHYVKTRRFVLDNKHKCQIKKKKNILQHAFRYLLPQFCFGRSPVSCQISSEREGRASKSGRHPIERTGIVLPIPTALPLA